MTFQSVGHCDVDFVFAFRVKKVEGKLLPEVVLQLMAGSTRIEMAGELVGGGFFLSFYKIPIEALCYGGILYKITPRHPLESSPFLASCKASPWHGNAQDESEKKIWSSSSYYWRWSICSHFILFLYKLINWPSQLCISPNSYFQCPNGQFGVFSAHLMESFFVLVYNGASVCCGCGVEWRETSEI